MVYDPLTLIEKLAALVPPPRFNLIRYHGILAPAARCRSQILPARPDGEDASFPRHAGCPVAFRKTGQPLRGEGKCAGSRYALEPPTQINPGPNHEILVSPTPPQPPGSDGQGAPPAAHASSRLTPAKRIDPLLPEDGDHAKRHSGVRPRNYSWAELLKRVFLADPLVCDRCGARMRIVSVINPPEAIRRILDCLGLPSRAPPIADARSDDQDDFELF